MKPQQLSILICITLIASPLIASPAQHLLVDSLDQPVGAVAGYAAAGPSGGAAVTMDLDGQPVHLDWAPGTGPWTVDGLVTPGVEFFLGFESADCTGAPYLYTSTPLDAIPPSFPRNDGPTLVVYLPTGAPEQSLDLLSRLSTEGNCFGRSNNPVDALPAYLFTTPFAAPYRVVAQPLASMPQSTVLSVPAVQPAGLVTLALALAGLSVLFVMRRLG